MSQILVSLVACVKLETDQPGAEGCGSGGHTEASTICSHKVPEDECSRFVDVGASCVLWEETF